ncbi:MAG: MerR family transcriptional regulator [Candidatus Marinimicrobia bacterium]|nr:MerR family transcriptional regulator [Candidatus Neomarinimicrobiota bacterium]
MKYMGIKKLYYSISEISEMLDIKQSVIRYWESEFKELKPQKNRAGNRIYKKDDIAVLRLIHHYVHEKHLSIHEANEMIMDLKAEGLYKRKLQELNQKAAHPSPVKEAGKEAIEPEPVIEETNAEPENETIQEESSEPEAKIEIVRPSEGTFIYPLDEPGDEEYIEEETVPEENRQAGIETLRLFEEPGVTEEIEQVEPEPEPVPEPMKTITEAPKSDPELKELLKKISGNIRDIIDILNE